MTRLPFLFDPLRRYNESVKATLEMINQMKADRVIGEYAIGGAVGATLYLEPAATLDVDIFIILPSSETSYLVSLSPIYEYLKTRGGAAEHEHIVIGGWPVQFLAPSNDLEREAIAEAVSVIVQGVQTRVMTAEHLVAIALRTGRAKDHARIVQFMEQKAVSQSKLEKILERNGLMQKWNGFQRRYLGETRE